MATTTLGGTVIKYAWIEENANSGAVTGIGREGVGGVERTGECSHIDLIWGMDNDKYNVVANAFVPVTQQEAENIDDARTLTGIKQTNKQKAKNQQEDIITEYAINTAKKALGLEVLEAELTKLQEHVLALEADINNPSSDPTYHPPLPPGVTAPDVEAISIVMTRPEGWNNLLGWKMVFTMSDPEYVPSNIAISVYSAENCTGYLYTPGALQQDAETGDYYVICPAGQEKGDVDYHFGLLYGSAQLACWTFAAGTAEEVRLIYGEEDEES